MSTVVVPRPRAARSAEATPTGKLAATLLSVTVAGLTESGRFRRGRAYQVERAVVALELEPGVLRAQVAGTRAAPYQVQVRVGTIHPPAGMGARPERSHIPRLVPDNDELESWCDCPDADAPCKHAAAALLVLADELVTRPELLVAWRCSDRPAARSTVGAQAGAGRHLQAVPGTGSTPPAADRRDRAEPSPFSTPAWHEFVGAAAANAPELDAAALLRDLPALRRGQRHVGRIDVGAVVADLVETVAHALGGPRR